ncbi:MAG TPA: histidine triad nucleotide-binding protein [Armatimonadetes bacterium]|nr:histidine triad nucleotide-binding protein [Armatimonadota bacterium]
MAQEETIFAKIVRGAIPCDKVYEDDLSLAFRDIAPVAPTHILIIPKEPLPSLAAASAEQADLLGHLLSVAAEIARREGVAEAGYRVVINHGAQGGQTVDHLHLHLLAGRDLSWPPG